MGTETIPGMPPARQRVDGMSVPSTRQGERRGRDGRLNDNWANYRKPAGIDGLGTKSFLTIIFPESLPLRARSRSLPGGNGVVILTMPAEIIYCRRQVDNYQLS